MWLLQRKNLHKKHLLWLKIIGFCASLHAILLLWIFCIYRENKYMYAFSVNKKMDYSIPILFLPCSAKATQGTPKKAEEDKHSTLNTVKPAITTATPPKKEPAKATTITTQPAKTNTKKSTESINKVIPIEPVKTTAAEKPIVQKNTEVPVAKKSTPEKPAAKNVTEPAVAKTAEKKIEPKENTTKNDTQALVSNNYREVEALRRGAQLQKELVQKWHPPIGVSSDCTCDISFFVTQKGTVENLKMVKSSGVMMFDISARQALFSMKMPQWTHGNPLIITFKQ